MKKLTVLPALLAALTLAACGGGGGDTTATSPADTAASKSPARHQDDSPKGEGQGTSSGQSRPRSDDGAGQGEGPGGGPSKDDGSGPAADDTSAGFTPPSHHDSPSGTAQFETKGGDNSIQEFGTEAPGSDFEAAAAALHGYLDARAAGAWRDACTYMSPAVAASLAQLGGGSGGGGDCPEILASLSAGVSPAALREAAVADVAALRTEGDRAFLLFRGAHGSDYFVPMAREGGEWKVAAIAPSALP